PILRREFLRRRFLKAMTLGPRVCSTSSATTFAPETSGAPTLGSPEPPTISTSVNSTLAPASPATFSMVMTSSWATRYCLPPVLMTAYMIFCASFRARFSRLKGLAAPCGVAEKLRTFSVLPEYLRRSLGQRSSLHELLRAGARLVYPRERRSCQLPTLGRRPIFAHFRTG